MRMSSTIWTLLGLYLIQSAFHYKTLKKCDQDTWCICGQCHTIIDCTFRAISSTFSLSVITVSLSGMKAEKKLRLLHQPSRYALTCCQYIKLQQTNIDGEFPRKRGYSPIGLTLSGNCGKFPGARVTFRVLLRVDSESTLRWFFAQSAFSVRLRGTSEAPPLQR